MRFTTELMLAGKTATGIEVPPEVVEALGAGKKPPVLVRINSHTYRSTIASRGGKYLLGVSAENRAAAGVAAGETVEVEIELDTVPREVDVPPELAQALEESPAAAAAFRSLARSKQQRLTIPIERGKSAETRQRNVEKALQSLTEMER